ncbi:MAG: glycosyltransferase family 4 protein [Flavobacteriales bacterium]|nr:glycosyltransferase family 4 protein [Flavobacteriales bacterium]
MRIVFTYLTAYTGNGGLEKFNQAFMSALAECADDLHIYSLHDDAMSEESAQFSKGYAGRRISYMSETIRAAMSADVLILGHVNLAPVAFLARLFRPRLKVVLITHGIEVWQPMSFMGKHVIKHAHRIFAVSRHTIQRLKEIFGVDDNVVRRLPNTLGRHFILEDIFEKNETWLRKYGLTTKNKVILTVGRMVSGEAYKGYDKVISVLPAVVEQVPETIYLLVGKYDQKEKERLDQLIIRKGMQGRVIFTGFIPGDAVADHFRLGDVFAMPSVNEGFGIVFIEAMAYGIPVIAGNKDGSVDALDDGRLGTLIDPDDPQALQEALISHLKNDALRTKQAKQQRMQEVNAAFGYATYLDHVKNLISEL